MCQSVQERHEWLRIKTHYLFEPKRHKKTLHPMAGSTYRLFQYFSVSSFDPLDHVCFRVEGLPSRLTNSSDRQTDEGFSTPLELEENGHLCYLLQGLGTISEEGGREEC